jgi:hypothetical protein
MRWLCFVVLSCAVACAQTPADTNPFQNHDPEKALITGDDVTLFWAAYDHWKNDLKGDPAKLPEALQTGYLDKGSQGVKDFMVGRIENAKHLSAVVLKNRAYFEGLRRGNNELVQNALPELHKDFRELKRLYPDAVFPPVYFVIGALSTGGTQSSHGLIIGAEMLSDQNPVLPLTDVVALVMHELVHFQQIHPDNDLLARCMREGTADFVAELVSGHNLNSRNKIYGDSHEEQLWVKFQQDTARNEHEDDWLYNYFKKDRVGPPDLGYYMGYKISQALYESAKDKSATLRMIIEMRDPQKIYELSGYGKRFSNQAVN